MAGRVSGAWLEPHLVVQREIAADKLRLLRCYHGQDAVDEVRLRVLSMEFLEALPLPLGEDVPRIWKRGDPAAIAQSRIPPDVVPVQMCTHDVVHIPRIDTGLTQARQKGVQLLHVPKRA